MPLKSSPSRTKTTLLIKFDCGFNNHLTIRGEGVPNLNWEKGVPLKNINQDEWIFETETPFKNGQYKILINDTIFETGENGTLKYGNRHEHTPRF